MLLTFLSILRHFTTMFFKVQGSRSEFGLGSLDRIGSLCHWKDRNNLFADVATLSFTVLRVPSSLQKSGVCKEDCACISKYYLKDSLLIWWEITLRLLLWFVFINSEPGAPVPLPGWRRKEQKRRCRPQGDDGLAVKAACRQDERSNTKKPFKEFVEATGSWWHKNV